MGAHARTHATAHSRFLPPARTRSLPVRSHSSAAPATPLRDALPSSLARNLWDRLKALRSSPSQLLGGGAGAPPEWQPRLAGAGLSGCGCAEASLLEAPGSSSSSSGRPRFAGEGCGARGPAGPQGMLATFKQMLRQVGGWVGGWVGG